MSAKDGRRLGDLVRFYSILDRLEAKIGGPRKLTDCSGRMSWPKRGVYFFHENGEDRTDTGEGPRVVRVGTHALTAGSGTKLWTRLSQHKGQQASGGGNHRGSIFRLIVGSSLIARDGLESSTWGDKNSAARSAELVLEREVSLVIGAMPFVWLALEDEPGETSRRGYIERNSIALLSNRNKVVFDPPSGEWLGRHCDRDRVRESGLWNSTHVDENYDPAFLDELQRLASETATS